MRVWAQNIQTDHQGDFKKISHDKHVIFTQVYDKW